jgi:hypothetical protein
VDRVLTDRDPDDETTNVERWRLEELERAGYSVAAAVLIASQDVDLHTAARLLARGCDEDTALRILL